MDRGDWLKIERDELRAQVKAARTRLVKARIGFEKYSREQLKALQSQEKEFVAYLRRAEKRLAARAQVPAKTPVTKRTTTKKPAHKAA